MAYTAKKMTNGRWAALVDGTQVSGSRGYRRKKDALGFARRQAGGAKPIKGRQRRATYENFPAWRQLSSADRAAIKAAYGTGHDPNVIPDRTTKGMHKVAVNAHDKVYTVEVTAGFLWVGRHAEVGFSESEAEETWGELASYINMI